MRDVGQRLRRLLYVVPYVAKHRDGVPVDDLAAMLDVSRDHLLRDLDLLSQVGPPDGDPGEYLLVSVEDGRVFIDLPQRLTRPLRLTPAEGCSLLLGIRALRDSGVVPFDDAMASAERKLLKALGRDREEAEKLVTDTVVAQPDRATGQHLRQLVTAARQRTQVVLEYVAASRHGAERRTLDPYGIVHHAGAWYLVGHCHKRGDTRTFRVDRIAALAPTEARFDIPDDFDLETYRREHIYVPSADAVAVHVHLEPLARARVGAAWPVGAVTHNQDDSAEIVIECEGFEWVTSWVLGFGEHAWIVQPEEARLAMRERLAQLSAALAPLPEPRATPNEKPDEKPDETTAPGAAPGPAAAAPAFPSRAALAAIIPSDHVHARPVEYLGDTLSLGIDSLPAEHAAIVRRLYGFLAALRDLTADRDRTPDIASELARFLAEQRFEDVIAECSALRAAMIAEETRALVRKTYHDVRGGSLTSLAGYLELALDGEAMPEDIARIALLARDHLKIMRNAIPDLDPAAHAADLDPKGHSVDLLREKWTAVTHHVDGKAAHVIIDCDFTGSVSSRCMEFSALDRVLYNLVNNAAQHTPDAQVLLRVFPIDDGVDTHLRFAVVNHVTAEQRARLEAALAGDLGRLFEGGFTTGGHGIGMGICGDIVTHSYGLRSVREACAQGYLGARILDDCFVAWFHWPAHRASAG
jgi:predicted DNA-binding transcriptional regulator YafY/signal transduction histidine kinase